MLVLHPTWVALIRNGSDIRQNGVPSSPETLVLVLENLAQKRP